MHLPLIGKPLLSSWQGPYLIHEKVGTHTYMVNMTDKRIKLRTFHVNAIKLWTPRGPAIALTALSEVDSPTVAQQLEILGLPTELEESTDPSLFGATDCQPTGGWPDVSHLPPESQTALRQLFAKHACLFSGDLGRFKGVKHDIDVGGNAPIKQHAYRTSPDKLEIMRSEVNAMLRMGLISPSDSEWSSPMLLVKKAAGLWRPVVDYRKVNSVSKGDSYPLPRLEDLIDKAGSASFISCVDFSRGYWQVPLTERAKDIATFVTPFGSFRPETMPFGLKAAASTFQRVINNVLSGMTFADAYQDDIAIQSNSWCSHLSHLDQVCLRLADSGITLNASKCKIAMPKVTYLGHQVGSGSIQPIHDKVKSMMTVPAPNSKKQLRSFLGVVGFYRRFIPKYSEIAAPLTDLLKGGVSGDIRSKWCTACDDAFTQLKSSLSTGPVLMAPDFSKPFSIFSDASQIGISGVLTQQDELTHKPVSYYSRKLLPREKNYSTVELELLAIIASLNAFRAYVGQGPITVFSDHNPLVWLKQSRTTNQRILRWALYLSEFDLSIQHIKGKLNVTADLLSRQIPE